MSGTSRPVGSRRNTPGDAALTGPATQAAIEGAVLGALGALALAGFETAIGGWFALGLPDSDAFPRLLGAEVGVGAGIGAIAGVTGLRGARWAMLALAIAFGLLASGFIADRVGESGGPRWVAPLLVVPFVSLVGFGLARTLQSGLLLFASSAAGFVLLALAVPANLHLLPQPAAVSALVLDGVVLLVALAVAAAAATVGGDGTPGRIAVGLVAMGVTGWGAAWPVLVPGPAPLPRATTDAGRPVVVVVIDGLRADHVGAYGYARPTTPNLDALARRALVYDDASSTAPWTVPALASILTGTEPSRHGAGVNDGRQNRQTGLRADVRTLAEVLGQQGYATAAVVSGRRAAGGYGFHRGFDLYDDRVGPSMTPMVLYPVTRWFDAPLVWPSIRDARATTDRALAFVQTQPHDGWALLVHYVDVTGPNVPPAEDLELLGGGSSGVVDHYDASIREVDREVGRLLAALPDDALVVVTGDHGEQLLETRPQANAAPNSERYGHSLFQELVRVPLIVSGPGVPARRVDRPVSITDVAPGLLGLLHVAIPDSMTGVPFVEATGGDAPADRAILAEGLLYGAEIRMARVGHSKLLQQGSSWALYDLREDPTEADPIVDGSDMQTVQQLQARLAPVGAALNRARPPISADVGSVLVRAGRVRPTSQESSTSPALPLR